jgi:hypothetical protein
LDERAVDLARSLSNKLFELRRFLRLVRHPVRLHRLRLASQPDTRRPASRKHQTSRLSPPSWRHQLPVGCKAHKPNERGFPTTNRSPNRNMSKFPRCIRAHAAFIDASLGKHARFYDLIAQFFRVARKFRPISCFPSENALMLRPTVRNAPRIGFGGRTGLDPAKVNLTLKILAIAPTRTF